MHVRALLIYDTIATHHRGLILDSNVAAPVAAPVAAAAVVVAAAAATVAAAAVAAVSSSQRCRAASRTTPSPIEELRTFELLYTSAAVPNREAHLGLLLSKYETQHACMHDACMCTSRPFFLPLRP